MIRKSATLCSNSALKRLQTGGTFSDYGSVVVRDEEDGFNFGCFKTELCVITIFFPLCAWRTIPPLPLCDGIKTRIPACAEVRAFNSN